ncbi:hypothetical protein [Streptomyces odonnellii]|uniref:hypothetical protein n=1 Tax=Streptomyces odonnellii TaxID=1417980 RepID=UPI000AA2EA88|nr:hypothetical protein [Streptomyces odonnellii]
MTATKKRSRQTKGKTAKARDWMLGPIPDDVFGSASDPAPQPGPQAPPLAIDERFEFLLSNPDLFEAVRQTLPAREPGSVGRPPEYPPYIYFVFLCSISIFGSARSTARHLQRELWWNPVREAARKHLGSEESDSLKPVGPSLSQWNYFFANHLKKHMAAVRDASRELWIRQALDMGMMAESRSRGSWVHPERDQVIHVDATVAKPPSKQTQHITEDKVTGVKRHRRVDPDASYTTEGGGRRVYGNKFLSLAVRVARTPHSRVILAMESIRHKTKSRDPEREDEGTAVVRLMHHLLSKAPGIRAFTYDTALRGVHRAPLIADGIVVFTRQHGGLEPHSLQRYEKTHKDNRKCSHDLFTVEGRICQRHFTVDGETYYTPLPVEELERRKQKKSRFYHRLVIPCSRGDHELRIRVDETKEDREIDPSSKKPRFNRAEHLRQIPPDTPAGRRLLGFRQDSESIHSRFDQAYPHERVPAYGANAGLLIYIGYAWVNNSITRALGQKPLGLAA